MGHPVHEVNVGQFFALARERYNILLRRRAGEKPPWTDDRIFRAWRFCNVFREDDSTTIWFRQRARRRVAADPWRSLQAVLAFRWYNRIETGERLLPWLLGRRPWNVAEVVAELQGLPQVVTGSFVVLGERGYNKAEGVARCVAYALEHLRPGQLAAGGELRYAHALLMGIPYLGGFMAYEMVSDLRYTSVLNNAEDIGTWCFLGPGATRGLGRLVAGNADYYNGGAKGAQEDMLLFARQLLLASRQEKNWPTAWPRWEMREVEHWLCEYDKYERVRAGGRAKRRYK